MVYPNTIRPPALFLALSDIKPAHSVFALPFALLAAFLASPVFSIPQDARPETQVSSPLSTFSLQLLLIVLCMVLARTWAMLVNRLADARFDADNPRTAGRVFASRRLTLGHGWTVAVACAAAFIAACAAFLLFGNPWPAVFSIPALGWIALYSYTKRFTWASHLFLGGALALSPIAAAIAVEPAVFLFSLGGMGVPPVPSPSTVILLLSGFVLLWVAGFDVAYALQDIDFDRRTGLHSIPARLGAGGALWASRVMHASAFALLVAAWRAEPRFGPIMLTGVAVAGGLLVFEHAVLSRRGAAGLPVAFFTVNGVVSCVLGAAGIADVIA